MEDDKDVFGEARSAEGLKPRSISPIFRPVERLDVDACLYRGEGNANIVISLAHERKILRFWKISSKEDAESGKHRVEREIKFIEDVVGRFLGSYARIPEFHRYEMNDIVRLSEAIQPLRPQKRREKRIMEEYATKYPDYAFLREDAMIGDGESLYRNEWTFCVEIKPKQGYLREPEHQPFEKCPYHLMQYYKLEKGEIAAYSDYCPFDLFSGDERRMHSAVTGLLKCPQNNLRIFKDGRVVYDDKHSSADLRCIFAECFSNVPTPETRLRHFSTLISSALLKSFYADRLVPSDIEVSGNRSAERNSLPSDSVLGRILRMQRLTYTATNDVYPIYSKHAACINDALVYADLTKNRPSLRLDISNRRGNDLSAKGQVVSMLNDEQSGDNEEKSKLSKHRDKEERIMTKEMRILRNYLLFCTAKDLSVLIAFRPLNSKFVSTVPPENVIKVSEDSFFAVTIGVVDLDPKKVRSIEKHHQREENILDSVIKKLSVDGNCDEKLSHCGLRIELSTRNSLDAKESSNFS